MSVSRSITIILIVIILACSLPSQANSSSTGQPDPSTVLDQDHTISNEVILKNPMTNAILISPPATIDSPGVYRLDMEAERQNNATQISQGLIITSDHVVLDGSGVTLRGGKLSGSLGISVTSIEPLHNISITNITLRDWEIGIQLTKVQNGQILGCIADSNSLTGISITNSTTISVNNTSCINNRPGTQKTGGAGIIITNSSSCIIQQNTIAGNGQGNDGSGITLIESSDIMIEENTISKNSGSGIRSIGQGNRLGIKDCIITSSGGNGIVLGSGSIGPQISGNTISQCKSAGIEATSSSEGIIAGNRIENNQVGISLQESSGYSLTTNDIRGNTFNLDVTGSSVDRYNHHISASNLADGRQIIYLVGAKGKTIGPSENPSSVYAINCSDLTISNLVFSHNGAGIFLIASHDITIRQVAALNNAFGIRVGYGSSDIRIEKSNTEKNLIAGYATSSSERIVFTDCNAQNNMAGFVIAASKNVTATRCTAINQEGLRRRGPSGFQITDSSGIHISDGRSEKNQFDGLYIKGNTDLEVSNMIISGNEIAGIADLSEGSQLLNNSITGNMAGGILLYGNTSLLTGNIIMSNKARGIVLDGTSDSIIFNNLFNNTLNIEITGETSGVSWNSSPQSGFSVSGGRMIAGNFWGNPDYSGFSDTCVPESSGVCAAPYRIDSQNIDLHPITWPERKNNSFVESSASSDPAISLDLNLNGYADLQDVITLMEQINNETEFDLKRDFNQDGRVNLQDVITLFDLIGRDI